MTIPEQIPSKSNSSLSALLRARRAEIADAWAEAVRHLPDSHYQAQPADRLALSISRCLDALAEQIDTGSTEAMQAYLTEVSLTRLQMGFGIQEVIEGLLLLKEIVGPFTRRSGPHDSATMMNVQAALDANLRRMLGQFGHLYAQAMNDQVRRQVEQLAVMEERQRLARDLHDSVNQAIYSVTLYAEAAHRLILAGQADKAIEHLGEMRSAAYEALGEMRLLIFELRPPVLEQGGLTEAIQARLDAVEARAGLRTLLRVEGESNLLMVGQEALYRIAQEALNNTLRHAQASQVNVTLHYQPDYVTLEVHDNGVGFDPAARRDRGGHGLWSMEERAQRMGGQVEIDSAPGRGTRVRATIPAGE